MNTIKILENRHTRGRKIIIFLILSIFILYLSASASFIGSDLLYIVVWVVTFFLNYHYNSLNYDKFMFVVLVIWSIINIIGFLINEGLNFEIQTFIGTTMKISLPYFMIKIIGKNFFKYLNKYIYYLTIVSLFFYFLDFIFPEFFRSMSSMLNFITQDEQKEAGGWYIYIYMHNAWAYITSAPWMFRNSGFMWEAGGNAMILIFSLTYNLTTKGFKVDKYVKIYTLALIFTFSTAGYLALFVILYAFISQRKRMRLLKILLIPILIFVTISVYEMNFIKGKIIRYEEEIDRYAYHNTAKVYRINRFGILKVTSEQLLVNPFGNGVSDSKYMMKKYGVIFNGSNTIARVLYIWGIVGLVFLAYYIYRYYYFLYRKNKIIPVLFSAAFLIVLFSNAIEYKPLLFCIVYFYLLYGGSKNELKPPSFATKS